MNTQDDKSKFVQFNRGYDMTIHKYPNAFNLLAIIAQRAKRSDRYDNADLEIGEAKIGDFKNYGMSRQEYRSSKLLLEKLHFSTFRTTNKGTIAKLVNLSVFNPNFSDVQPSTQPTKQHSSNQQATTKNNDNNEEESDAISQILQIKGNDAKLEDGTLLIKGKVIKHPASYLKAIEANISRPREQEGGYLNAKDIPNN